MTDRFLLRKEWEKRIAAFRASGQSMRAWCKANNLKPRQLSYWIGKFKDKEKYTDTDTQWLPLEITPDKKITQDSSEENILLVKIGRAEIEIKPGFDQVLLLNVVKVLEKLC
ncbi:MAG: helix-turn-helix domain-containing protein [Peptococcaceae bacterium]|nr:helix-turn-helix domain-containing protein [Peptococcaceae bacterium]